jgi:reductive dehalogenase
MTRPQKKITRREFFRLTGIAATTASVGSLFSENQTREKSHPWWVRIVDEPTTEINWERIQRFDPRKTVFGQGLIDNVGEEEVKRLSKIDAENEKQRLLKKVPGYTLKDQALRSALGFGTYPRFDFLGPRFARTPEDREVRNWIGDPDEAARNLRAAMRFFGAATVGFVELNARNRKFIYSHDPDGKQLVFEDVEQAYETDEKRVIPSKAKWAIAYTVQMSDETLKRAPTALAASATNQAYYRGATIQNMAQEFLRGLGYQGLGASSLNALGVAPALGVIAGLGELSRLNRLITPEYGPMVRVFLLITDLPLTTDKPIDAGIMKFCKQCKKCAETCPPGALSFEDEPSWEPQGDWSNPGHKTFFEDGVKCYTYWREVAGSGCGICFAVCPFAKKDKAWAHAWAKASISLFPLLNSFFRSMDDAFSYGAQKDPDAWWDLDLPEYGIDTDRSE